MRAILYRVTARRICCTRRCTRARTLWAGQMRGGVMSRSAARVRASWQHVTPMMQTCPRCTFLVLRLHPSHQFHLASLISNADRHFLYRALDTKRTTTLLICTRAPTRNLHPRPRKHRQARSRTARRRQTPRVRPKSNPRRTRLRTVRMRESVNVKRRSWRR